MVMEEVWLKSERGRVKLDGEYGDADVENLKAVVVVVMLMMMMMIMIYATHLTILAVLSG